MTCIVGMVQDGRVHIGADSLGVGGWTADVLRTPKLLRPREDLLLGYTTSYRFGQLLQYELAGKLPKHEHGVKVEEWVVTGFVPTLRKCLEEGGWLRKKEERESGGVCLLGYRGHLFKVQSEFSVLETRLKYDTVGSGESVAMGAMHAILRGMPGGRDLDAEWVLRQALAAAQEHTSYVRRPFRVEVL